MTTQGVDIGARHLPPRTFLAPCLKIACEDIFPRIHNINKISKKKVLFNLKKYLDQREKNEKDCIFYRVTQLLCKKIFFIKFANFLHQGK